MTTSVTVLGLGLMGRALADGFVRAGHATTVWNRTAAKAGDLAAHIADSPGAAVGASPLVVVCVSDYDAVHKILDPLGDALDGRVLVNLASGTSAQARETAAWAARRGAGYLDGAIMAVPDGIGTPDALLVYSGPRPVFAAHEPVLAALGDTVHLGDEPSLAALHEVAVLDLMWGILNGYLHGAALLGRAGVRAEAYTPIASRGIATVTGWLAGYARQIDDGSYPPVDATIDTHVAAMRHVVEESEALGVDTSLPRFVKALADRSAAAGHGASGYPALIELFRGRSAEPGIAGTGE